ncbi:MAG: transglycosylase domain-containing protein [Patescibacteria group bacterium]
MQSPTRKKYSRKQITRLSFVFITTVGLSFVASLVLYVAILIKQLPSPDQFGDRKINQSTKLYDRTGAILLYEIHGEEKRTIIPFDQIPGVLKEATLAAEDINFYKSRGFDIKGIARAFLTNLKEGRFAQGGSTITQQLAKNMFLSSERTIIRKVKELILAIELESKYNKDEIFSLYLNQIPYGSNAYGVEAASQTYFNKSSKELTLSESAVLASLPRAPSFYSPWGSHLKDLLSRKDYVLDRMAEVGFITKEDANAGKGEKIEFAPPSIGKILAPHFSLAVKDYLARQFGEDEVENGGLRVITTLDWEMQQIAERVVLEGAIKNEELYSGKNAALVAEDPKTGQILAMVGSRDYFDVENEGNFNVATQGLRQPGSALKPFAYLAAFEKGYSPKSVVFDVPTEFTSNDINCPVIVDFSAEKNKDCFHPQNFDGVFRGPVSLENGLAQSINIPSVKTLYLAGSDNVLDKIHQFGIKTLNERGRYGLSLILGGGEVKLIDLVSAYSTLSQEGVRHDQSLILKVESSDGKLVEEYSDKTNRASEANYVRLINQILSDIELRSGLLQSSLPLTIFSGKDVALKTGTTNDYRDAWAMGYTPSFVVGVWAGNNDNKAMERRGSSILAAVPIWSAFLKETLLKYPSETFQAPDPISPIQKPMLNGEYVYNQIINGQNYSQIHSILYYVDKKDPLGPLPEEPSADPQFNNWEAPVMKWASENIQNFHSQSQIGGFINTRAPEGSPNVSVVNFYPSNGSFVNNPFLIKAEVRSGSSLQKIDVYFNKSFVASFSPAGNYYSLQQNINHPLLPQNLIEIKIKDVFGKESLVSSIVFH